MDNIDTINKLKKIIELYEISTKLDYEKIIKLQEENKLLKDKIILT